MTARVWMGKTNTVVHVALNMFLTSRGTTKCMALLAGRWGEGFVLAALLFAAFS